MRRAIAWLLAAFLVEEPILREVLSGYTLVQSEDPRERFEVLATRA